MMVYTTFPRTAVVRLCVRHDDVVDAAPTAGKLIAQRLEVEVAKLFMAGINERNLEA